MIIKVIDFRDKADITFNFGVWIPNHNPGYFRVSDEEVVKQYVADHLFCSQNCEQRK